MNDFLTSLASPSDGASKIGTTGRMIFTIALILIASSCTWAEENDPEFLYAFLQGTYEVVGRWPDSQRTYSGKMILSRKANFIKVIRTIGGEETEAVGKIETATADKIKVLRVQFTWSGEQYEATYLIGSDLDNFGRMTGYVYSKERPTAQPGLEALFYDRHAGD